MYSSAGGTAGSAGAAGSCFTGSSAGFGCSGSEKAKATIESCVWFQRSH